MISLPRRFLVIRNPKERCVAFTSAKERKIFESRLNFSMLPDFPKLACFRNCSSRAIGKMIYPNGKTIFDFFIETFLWLLRVSKVVTIAIEWVSQKWVSNNRIYFGANQHTKTTNFRTLRTVPCFADSSTHRKSNRALTYRKWRVESNVWKWVAWYTGCRIVR